MQRLKKGYLFRNPALVALFRFVDGLGGALFRRRAAAPPNRPKKILIAKIDHLGDVLMALRVLPAVRAAHPEAEIDFLCGSWARGLIEGHPLIRRIHAYDHFMLGRSGGVAGRILKNLADFRRVSRILKEERYDLAVDLRAYFPNALPLLAAGKIGFIAGFPSGGFGFLLNRAALWREGAHETGHFWDALEAAGIGRSDAEPDLKYLAASDPSVDGFLEAARGRKVVVVHPGTGNKIKRWRLEEWRKLLQKLEAQKYAVACTGAAEEREFAQGMIAGTRAANFCGKTSLRSLAALLSAAAAVVGVDSFVPHLAAALGVKTVAIFNGIEYADQWKPLGPRASAISRPVPCSPCFRKNGCETMDCLNTTAEEVLAALDR